MNSTSLLGVVNLITGLFKKYYSCFSKYVVIKLTLNNYSEAEFAYFKVFSGAVVIIASKLVATVVKAV